MLQAYCAALALLCSSYDRRIGDSEASFVVNAALLALSERLPKPQLPTFAYTAIHFLVLQPLQTRVQPWYLQLYSTRAYVCAPLKATAANLVTVSNFTAEHKCGTCLEVTIASRSLQGGL